jgi:hypothetical protein
VGLTLERWTNYRPAGRWQQLLAGLITFHVVGLGWVLFHAGSLAAAWRFVLGLFGFEQMHWLGVFALPVLLTAALVLALDLAEAGLLKVPAPFVARARPVLVVAALVALVGLGLLDLARGTDARPFIYGQF